jgi:hypothetical protein
MRSGFCGGWEEQGGVVVGEVGMLFLKLLDLLF